MAALAVEGVIVRQELSAAIDQLAVLDLISAEEHAAAKRLEFGTLAATLGTKRERPAEGVESPGGCSLSAVMNCAGRRIPEAATCRFACTEGRCGPVKARR